MSVIATNRKAYRDFEVIETLESGIELKGGEVKSLRDGKLNFEGSYARIDKGEIILYNMHINPYEQASYLNVEPTRPRKLLLHKAQINKLAGDIAQRGWTLVPLKAYFSKSGYVKVELGLCKGKKLYDRRDDIKRRESNLEMRRAAKAKRGR